MNTRPAPHSRFSGAAAPSVLVSPATQQQTLEADAAMALDGWAYEFAPRPVPARAPGAKAPRPTAAATSPALH